MIQESLLPEQLKSFKYYKNKLPLYLQQSYGFQEHFKIWYDLLIGGNHDSILGTSETILNLLCIFDNDYLDYIASFEDSGATEEIPYGTHSDILDKIGKLFGVARYFTVTIEEMGEENNYSLELNNEEFLILIKTQIIKAYCEGTNEQINQYYKEVGLHMYCFTSSEPATAYLYLATSSGGVTYNYSENIRKMFLAGLLEIESMGIVYRRQFVNLDRILFWDSENNGWDVGEWVL